MAGRYEKVRPEEPSEDDEERSLGDQGGPRCGMLIARALHHSSTFLPIINHARAEMLQKAHGLLPGRIPNLVRIYMSALDLIQAYSFFPPRPAAPYLPPHPSRNNGPYHPFPDRPLPNRLEHDNGEPSFVRSLQR